MKYITNGMRSAEAETMNEAARIFANRQARREFGRRGEARTCKPGSYAQDGSLGEYQAFIGVTSNGQTTGKDFHFTVWKAADHPVRFAIIDAEGNPMGYGSTEEQAIHDAAVALDITTERVEELLELPEGPENFSWADKDWFTRWLAINPSETFKARKA